MDVEEIDVDCLILTPFNENDAAGATSANRMAKNFIIEMQTTFKSRSENKVR